MSDTTQRENASQSVLVGTYRIENKAWILERKVYNLPLPDNADAKVYEKFTSIVLYAGDELPLAYTAAFSQVVDKSWLKENGYSMSSAPHGMRYVLFSLKKKISASRLLANPFSEVFVCSTRWTGKIDAEFYSKPLPDCGGKSIPNVFEKIKPYFNKWRAACAFNPVQMDFFGVIDKDLSKLDVVTKRPAEGVKYAMIDLFAGAGGLSEGLEEAGFHSVFASEIVPQYADTYRKNHPGTTVMTQDIRKLDAESIRKQLGIRKGQLALIAGGPPCQGFSINAPIRSTLDQRNHLFKEYLRFVDVA